MFSSTQPASDIYEDEGILMISPGATNPELTQRGYQHIMRTAGLDSSQGPTAAKYILETVKPQRIAIIHDKQQYGEGLARSVQDGLKAANANVVFFDGITAGEKDFSALIARLKKENIDFVTTAVTTRKWADAAPFPFRWPENSVYGAGRCG
ncbi:Leucine-specific transport system [Escherichia coli]|uniref:Leucine-specific transport system n=1 Tax=Escherichia coli TaxID=562 RepID=A0A377AP16_ECOLX|nr:Leucine-specific transport system [Escherichia coli]